VTHLPEIADETLRAAAFAFVVTGQAAADRRTLTRLRALGCPVHAPGFPDLSDLATPALVNRDPLVVAIGSEGMAPVLTQDTKARIETLLPVNLGGLVRLVHRLRAGLPGDLSRHTLRALMSWALKGAPRRDWALGKERATAARIKAGFATGQADQGRSGHVSLVGAGPGAKDLLTLRAVQRLQEADVVFYDRLVEQEVLDLAHPEAEKVFVGKHVGAHSWPQDRINAVIVAEAKKGRHVVRLKSGDPSVFGRAGEELAAAHAQGITTEIVPGITAASAGAAAMGAPLTERGVANTLVLTTGMSREGDPLPDSTRLCQPGTTTAFYMSVRQAARIRDALIAKGFAPTQPVRVAVDVSKPSEQLIECPLGTLEETLSAQGCTGCAVILVTWPGCVFESQTTGADAASAEHRQQVPGLRSVSS
jgi:uroporphyrin-III C-methyltransferase/precorrin-2 dehydrogenase/sirohydrochlorin ferrochelatase